MPRNERLCTEPAYYRQKPNMFKVIELLRTENREYFITPSYLKLLKLEIHTITRRI